MARQKKTVTKRVIKPLPLPPKKQAAHRMTKTTGRIEREMTMGKKTGRRRKD